MSAYCFLLHHQSCLRSDCFGEFHQSLDSNAGLLINTGESKPLRVFAHRIVVSAKSGSKIRRVEVNLGGLTPLVPAIEDVVVLEQLGSFGLLLHERDESLEVL